MSMVYF